MLAVLPTDMASSLQTNNSWVCTSSLYINVWSSSWGCKMCVI